MALTPQQEADLLRAEMDRQGVTDPQLRAGIAAIAMGESAFQMKPEMGYAHTSNERIREIFTHRVQALSEDDLDRMKADPEGFFNFVYGGAFGAQQLGNTDAGDGFKFRGRGLFQLTGRGNYAKYGHMIGRDLLTDPEVADDPQVACAVAVAYMRDRYHGGGWSKMKQAVGFNISDIASTKDKLFARYSASREFGPSPTGDGTVKTVGTTAVHTDLAGPVVGTTAVRPAVDRLKAIQTVLQEGGQYRGQIDGKFGAGSRMALDALIDRARVEGG